MSNVAPSQNPFADNPTAQIFDQPQNPKSKTGCILLGLGGGCLVMVLVCAGLGGLGIVGLFTAIKSSQPYTESLQRTQSNEELGSKIGQPIEPDMIVMGNINLQNNDGNADLSYRVTGPDGTATIDVKGRKTDGVWSYEKMKATMDDGSVVDLLETVQQQ
jgi:hypothetical protein